MYLSCFLLNFVTKFSLLIYLSVNVPMFLFFSNICWVYNMLFKFNYSMRGKIWIFILIWIAFPTYIFPFPYMTSLYNTSPYKMNIWHVFVKIKNIWHYSFYFLVERAKAQKEKELLVYTNISRHASPINIIKKETWNTTRRSLHNINFKRIKRKTKIS